MACDQLKTVFINSSRLFSTTPHWSVADILRFSPGSGLERWPCTCCINCPLLADGEETLSRVVFVGCRCKQAYW
ncbi:hypothetical protein T4E_4328 [Trichinella pseudospiralis]|uniref:Uncharacterized protein n=1 Tax=Trichinella pseudospiralis TaxID=6337 RepID=A0A0V0XKL2_TRIPS|nr:hypothetical protein T4E_4328 [Trichinella pseudospiralis]